MFEKISFNKIKIKTQVNMLLYALLICCIILGAFIYDTIRTSMEKNANDYTQYVTDQFNREVDYFFDKVSHIYQLQLYDSEIETILSSPISQSSYDLLHLFSPISVTYSEIVDIALTNPTFHWSTLYDNFTLNTMSNKLRDYSSPSLGLYTTKSKDHKDFDGTCLVFGYQLYGAFTSGNEHIGDLIISLDIEESLSNLQTYDSVPTTFVIFDNYENYYVLYSSFSDTSDDLDSLILTCQSTILDNPDLTLTTINDSNYTTVISNSNSADLYLVTILDNSELYLATEKTKTLVTFLWLILIGFILLFAFGINRNLVMPINKFQAFVSSIQSGNRKQLNKNLELDGSIELHTLGNEFNLMLHELATLNKQLFQTTTNLYEMELEKQEIEIAHLRSQVNPHFLYNTLEVMKGISLENNVPQIALICNAMGTMFRYSIKGEPTVTFEEELNIAKAYLQIQTLRFTDRFQIIYNIDENSLQVQTLKMLLQPIIENAILHGLEKKTEDGILYIATHMDHNVFTLIIQDNGMGINEKKLAEIHTSLITPALHTNNRAHIGLLNIHHRIQLFYGDTYGLSIESMENEGTIITLTFPTNKI